VYGILNVGLSSGLDELLNDFRVTLEDGRVQGCSAAIVFQVFVGAAAEQEQDDVEMSSDGCALKFT
jgi:hypothetical protein